MKVRTLLKGIYPVMVGVLLTLSTVAAANTTRGLHYGLRTDTLQPIHSVGGWLWYSQFHAQIPSFDKHSRYWLVTAGSGIRRILRPYFSFGFYIAGGQLHSKWGNSYLINPGVEFCFPWAKLGIHAYFIEHPMDFKEQPIEQLILPKHAIDVKCSATFLSFVSLFLSGYYISKLNPANASRGEGALSFNYGFECLMTPQCSLEISHEVQKGSFWVRLKVHSAKARKPFRRTRAIHHVKEPVDQYTFPIMLLSPNASEKGVFSSAAKIKAEHSSRKNETSIPQPLPLNVQPPRVMPAVTPEPATYKKHDCSQPSRSSHASVSSLPPYYTGYTGDNRTKPFSSGASGVAASSINTGEVSELPDNSPRQLKPSAAFRPYTPSTGGNPSQGFINTGHHARWARGRQPHSLTTGTPAKSLNQFTHVPSDTRKIVHPGRLQTDHQPSRSVQSIPGHSRGVNAKKEATHPPSSRPVAGQTPAVNRNSIISPKNVQNPDISGSEKSHNPLKRGAPT